MDEYQKRLESEQKSVTRITNYDLVCRDCAQKFDDSEIYGNVSRCKVYPKCKPLGVLNGEGCKEHVKV